MKTASERWRSGGLRDRASVIAAGVIVTIAFVTIVVGLWHAGVWMSRKSFGVIALEQRVDRLELILEQQANRERGQLLHVPPRPALDLPAPKPKSKVD